MSAEPSEKLPELLAAKEVAASLELSEAAVVRFARLGILRGLKVGREWRFRAEDIQTWLEVRRLTPEEFSEHARLLFERLGKGLRASGLSEEDIPRLIEEVRRERRVGRKTPSHA